MEIICTTESLPPEEEKKKEIVFRHLICQYYKFSGRFSKRVIAALSLLLLISLIFLVIYGSVLGAFFTLLFLYCFFLYFFVEPRNYAKRLIKEMKSASVWNLPHVVYTLNEKGIHVKAGSSHETITSWDKITGLAVLEDGLVFYRGEHPLQFVIRFMKTEQEMEGIIAVAKENKVRISH